MRRQLGWLAFALCLAFAAGLFLILALVTFSSLDGQKAFLGFFGFGIPMAFSGLGTVALWHDDPEVKVFAWAAVAYAFACGVCLILVVATYVFVPGSQAQRPTGVPSDQ